MKSHQKSSHKHLNHLLVLCAMLIGLTTYISLPRFGANAQHTDQEQIEQSLSVNPDREVKHIDTANNPYSVHTYENAVLHEFSDDRINPANILFTAQESVQEYTRASEILTALTTAFVVSAILGYSIAEYNKYKGIHDQKNNRPGTAKN